MSLVDSVVLAEKVQDGWKKFFTGWNSDMDTWEM
jgi:hypothetical protein